jgi:hypothetical protein
MWTTYYQNLEDHATSMHSKDNPDDSCIECYPVTPSALTEGFKTFINWFSKDVAAIYHYTSKTFGHFVMAKSDLSDNEQWIEKMILSFRYKKQQDLSDLVAVVAEEMEKTEGFTKEREIEEENVYENINHDRILVSGHNSEKGYEEQDEEEDDSNDKEVLMVRALQQIMKELKKEKNNNGTNKKESRLVDFPTFSGGDQDPIHWIESFERACIANNIQKERILAIVASYLKGTALTWFNKSKITEWDDALIPNRSFKHTFMKQYCSTFKKAQWKQQLRAHKQRQGETIESYTSKIYELWHRIDPQNRRTEEDKIQEYIEGLRPEFTIHVQGMMPTTVEQAIEKARSIEIALSMNMGLSDYSLGSNYLKKTHGGAIPMIHAVATNEENDISSLIENRIQKSFDQLTKKLDEQMGYNNNTRRSFNNNYRPNYNNNYRSNNTSSNNNNNNNNREM